MHVLTFPIIRFAMSLEARHKLLLEQMAPEIRSIDDSFKARERFEAVDAIYTKHGYHPIKSIVCLLPLFLQLPFLLAALFLLIDYPPLSGVSFGLIRNLAMPDALLAYSFAGTDVEVNLLPLLLIGIALMDSYLKPTSTRQTQMRFLIVCIVLLLLIYALPASVCLY